jgi:hypothetical protein
MVPNKSLALTLLAIAGAASAASAQGFMLFGDKNVLPEGDQQFVMPITSPFYNENSLVTTDVRLVFAHHRLNNDSILGDDAWANVVGSAGAPGVHGDTPARRLQGRLHRPRR